MKCPKCGKEFEGNFCPNCGEPVTAKQPDSQASQQPYTYGTYQQGVKTKKQPRTRKMMTCKSCGNQIAKTANRCPYCGARQHKGALIASGILIAIIFICIIGAIVDNDADTNPQQYVDANAGTSTSEISTAEKIDYKVLSADYSKNPINADKKYKNKQFIITGKIDTIDRDIAQSPYITFSVDSDNLNDVNSIKMAFSNDEAVAKLEKGQTVTVMGTCKGTFASTLITFSDCEIIK